MMNVSFDELCKYVGSDINRIIFIPSAWHENIPDHINIVMIVVDTHAYVNIINTDKFGYDDPIYYFTF